MKRILIVLAVVLFFSPTAAYSQKWIEPHRQSDGTMVEGHWQTPEEARKQAQAKPKPVNPHPGQIYPSPGGWTGSGGPFPHPLAPQPWGPGQPGGTGYRR